jgi:hypothetical protein
VLVKLATEQLSVAVGGVQLTINVHAPASGCVIVAGQSLITGGSESTSAGSQQIGPPIRLEAAITVKLPETLPIKAAAQKELMVVLLTPLTVRKMEGPTNLSLGIDPVNVNIPPGTTVSSNTIPN